MQCFFTSNIHINGLLCQSEFHSAVGHLDIYLLFYKVYKLIVAGQRDEADGCQRHGNAVIKSLFHTSCGMNFEFAIFDYL
jgi:hypothetical protein